MYISFFSCILTYFFTIIKLFHHLLAALRFFNFFFSSNYRHLFFILRFSPQCNKIIIIYVIYYIWLCVYITIIIISTFVLNFSFSLIFELNSVLLCGFTHLLYISYFVIENILCFGSITE
jgi:hypothetical protein